MAGTLRRDETMPEPATLYLHPGEVVHKGSHGTYRDGVPPPCGVPGPGQLDRARDFSQRTEPSHVR